MGLLMELLVIEHARRRMQIFSLSNSAQYLAF
jgi:hypothetical protein